MSGIGGILYLDDRQVLSEELTSLIKSISHRGTDKTDYYLTGRVGLIHCMLYTTPESLEEPLPYTDSLSGNTITADARIDNREDLIAELGLSGITAKIPDSQLILKAYNKWGEDCAQRLIGDFAFAVWDHKQQKIFCARDHMGVKPFYYFHSSNIFIFGSEIKAILQTGMVATAINEQRILDYLVFYNSDHSSTFYRDIRRLPARHKLSVTPHHFRVEPYWDFSPKKELRLPTDDEYAAAFREHFEKAVSCRLRSAYPVGAFLSGGLDSSSIACVASKQMIQMGREPLITFSEIFESLPPHVQNKADERQYMDAAIQHCRSEAHFVPINEHGPLRGLDATNYDEPMPYFNGYLLDQTYIDARKRGVRVLLDGTDGDTTVSHGYERLYNLGTRCRLFTLLTETRDLCRLNNHKFSIKETLWKYSIRPSFSDDFVDSVKRLIGKADNTHKYPMVDNLQPNTAHGVDWEARAQTLGEKHSTCRQGRLPQYRSFISPAQQYAMEFIDNRGAYYPIESRYPFWDRRLMEFCLALPLEQKLKNGWTRVILRRAMKGILPPITENR